MTGEALQRAVFACHVWTSARLQPLLVGRQDMRGVRRYTTQPPRAPYAGLPADYVVRQVLRALRRPLLMRDRRCLREGLLGFRFLGLAGYEPELRFGIDRNSVDHGLLKAHCWVCLDGRSIISGPLPDMIEIHRIPGGSRVDRATAER